MRPAGYGRRRNGHEPGADGPAGTGRTTGPLPGGTPIRVAKGPETAGAGGTPWSATWQHGNYRGNDLKGRRHRWQRHNPYGKGAATSGTT